MTLRQAICPSQDLYAHNARAQDKADPVQVWRYGSYILKLGIRRPLHVPREKTNIPGVDLLKITKNHGYKKNT